MEQFKTFHRDGLTGRENQGKILLVVGVGNIGYEIVQIGRGLDMIVRGVDIVSKHSDVDYVDFDEALPDVDIIVSAMNLTPENTGNFHYERMKKRKSNALFINVARGEQSPPISSDFWMMEYWAALPWTFILSKMNWALHSE